MAFFQALVLALIALTLTPGYLFYFDITPKSVILLVGTAVALVWASVSGLPLAGKPAKFGLLPILLLANIGSLALSTAVSTRPELSLFGTNWRQSGSLAQTAVCVFAWLIAVNCAGRPERVRTVLRGVAIAGAASAVYGIAQYFGWDPLLPSAAYRVGEGVWTIVRPPGTLGYASYFATWLLFVAFLSLGLRTMEVSRAGRWFAVASAIVAGIALVLTGTRAAVLALVTGAMVWAMVGRVRIPRRALVAAAIAIAAGVAFYFAPPGQQMRARSRWFVEDPWGGARLSLWRDSVKMAAAKLPAGYGPEVYTAEFPRFESLALAQAYPNFWHESPHNIFLDVLVAQGLPGLLLLAGLCAAGLAAAWRSKHAAFAATLAAAIVSQQFTAFTLPTAVMFWVTLGLVAASTMSASEPRRRVAWIGGAAILAVALLFVAVRFAFADHALELTKRGLDEGNLARAVEQYRRYENARFPGGSADIWYSRALVSFASRSGKLQVRLTALAESRAAALDGTRTAEDPFNAWYNLAVICGGLNDGSCVEHSLRRAIGASPMWFKPHWALAQVLNLTGRIQEAQAEAARAAELDAGKDAEVTRTLHEIQANVARVHLLQK